MRLRKKVVWFIFNGSRTPYPSTLNKFRVLHHRSKGLWDTFSMFALNIQFTDSLSNLHLGFPNRDFFLLHLKDYFKSNEISKKDRAIFQTQYYAYVC